MKQKKFTKFLLSLIVIIIVIGGYLVYKNFSHLSTILKTNPSNQKTYINNWYGYSIKYPSTSELYFVKSLEENNYIFIPDNEGPRVFLGGKNKNGKYNGPICDVRIYKNQSIDEWSRPGVDIKSETINGIRWDIIFYKGGRDLIDSSLAAWHTSRNGLVFAINTIYEARNRCRDIVSGFKFTTNTDSEEMKVRLASEKYVEQNIDSNFIFLAGSFIEDSYTIGGGIEKTNQPTNTAALVFDDKDSYPDHQDYERTLVIMKKNNGNWILFDRPENPGRYIWN